MKKMFAFSQFTGNISKWDISKVTNMSYMFKDSIFKSDISNWKINDKCETYDVFLNCPIKEDHKPELPE